MCFFSRRKARIMPARRSSCALSIAPSISEAREPLLVNPRNSRGPAGPIKVAAIDQAAGPFVQGVVVGHHRAAFAAGHVLEIIEAERSAWPIEPIIRPS